MRSKGLVFSTSPPGLFSCGVEELTPSRGGAPGACTDDNSAQARHPAAVISVPWEKEAAARDDSLAAAAETKSVACGAEGE